MLSKISSLLKGYGVSDDISIYLSYVLLIILIIIICLIVNIALKSIILKLVSRIIMRDKFRWDNIMMENKVFLRLVDLSPGIIVYLFSSAFAETTKDLIQRGCAVYIAVIALFIINALLNSIDQIYRSYPISKVRPIKGLLQVIKIVFYIIIGFVIIAILMDQNPFVLIGGLGALAAVFSFVFKDSILGFIAGIQLTSNDMLRIGDWIEMSKYGADGDVIDITLNTVKIQNFDKTIVTLPAYSLVSDAFKNWRGMAEAGGRRIKRSVIIDINSICFCTPQMIEKFKKIDCLKEYIKEKEAELRSYNDKYHLQDELNVNKRQLTNIGVFRIYLENYLKNNSKLSSGMTQMVRQLPQGQFGLPLEIYVFTNDIKWENYERIQSDIFDHVFAVAKEFDLRLFQTPTGHDMQQLGIAK